MRRQGCGPAALFDTSNRMVMLTAGVDTMQKKEHDGFGRRTVRGWPGHIRDAPLRLPAELLLGAAADHNPAPLPSAFPAGDREMAVRSTGCWV